jgi:hypothetical protein
MICAIFLAILCWPVIGQAYECPDDINTRVSVTPNTKEIKTDFTRSKHDLDYMSPDRHNPYGRYSLTDVGGLMEGTIRIETDASFMLETNQKTGDTCAWFEAVNVSINIDPTIFVAREYPEGSCLHEAIYWHEIKHVNTDRKIVNKYLPRFERAINDYLYHDGIQGPVSERFADRLQEDMMTELTDKIYKVSQAMEAERHERQKALDSREEYDRVMGECR